MRAFNAFQITAAFVAWPFLVAWLHVAEFRGAAVAFWAALVCYVVAFIGMVLCVYNTISEEE